MFNRNAKDRVMTEREENYMYIRVSTTRLKTGLQGVPRDKSSRSDLYNVQW